MKSKMSCVVRTPLPSKSADRSTASQAFKNAKMSFVARVFEQSKSAGQLGRVDQRARYGDAFPSTVVKGPPTTRSPFERVASAYATSFSPLPRGDHDEPSHRAIRLVIAVPAIPKPPPAMMSPLGKVVSA